MTSFHHLLVIYAPSDHPRYGWGMLWHLANWLGSLLAGAVLLVFRRWRQERQENLAAGWPTAYAQVQAVLVEGEHRQARVLYRYYAEGQARYGEYRRHFRKPLEATEFALKLRGQQVMVRYDPSQPDTSVLIERELSLQGLL